MQKPPNQLSKKLVGLLAYTLILLTLPCISNGQNLYVQGTVLDSLGQVLPGATIEVSPGGQSVMSDNNGYFSLSIKQIKDAQVLKVRMLGMRNTSLSPIPFNQDLQIILKPASQALNELVLTGYNDLSKARSAGSVSTLVPEDLDWGVRNLDEMIQGKVPGLVTLAQSGRPGEKYKVTIRGTNTISGNTEPLWVIDGVPVQGEVPELNSSLVKSDDLNEILNSGISYLDPSDIAQITVLKDASAAAIYGSRAAGGVIVISTKKGQSGKPRISYTSTYNIGLHPQRDANLMRSDEKIAWEKELWNEFSKASYQEDAPHVPIIGIYGSLMADRIGQNGLLWNEPGFIPYTSAEKDNILRDLAQNSTDWFGLLFQNAQSHNHHLSISGGTDKQDYYVSLGYTGQNGLVKETGYEKFNINAKINTKIGNKLDLGWNVNLSRQTSDSYAMSINPFEYAYFANPYERAFDANGTFINDQTYTNLHKIHTEYYDGNLRVMEPSFGYNIFNEMENTHSNGLNHQAILSMSLNYDIVPKLQFSGLVSYQYTGNASEDVKGAETYAAFQDRLFFDDFLTEARPWTPYGSITQTQANAHSYLARGHFIYKDQIKQHAWRLWAGAEIRGSHTDRFFTKRYGYNEETRSSSMPQNPVPEPGDQSEYEALINNLSGQVLSDARFASFYTSADYTFLSRYVLNATLRTDGSNNFGSHAQFNPTWSLGAAWHIAEEPFFEPLLTIVSHLTVRAATGFTGNVVPGIKKALVLTYDPSTWNNLQTGRIQTAPNPNLRWEKTRDKKLSLDFGFLRDRIQGSVETYFRRSDDLITESIIHSTTGFANQWFNTSTIDNRGLEVSMRVQALNGKDFSLSIAGNMAWNENKLIKYYNARGEKANIIDNAGLFVGYPTNGLFGGKYIGIDPYTGLYSFQLRPDAQLQTSGDLNNPENYLFYLGTPQPDVSGGAHLSARYKQFSLSVGGTFFFGAKILNNLSSPARYGSIGFGGGSSTRETPQSTYSDLYRNHLNVTRDVTNRWTPENSTNVLYPRIVDYAGEQLFLNTYNPFNAAIVNSAFRENVSFFRLRNITLNYQLPQHWIRHTKLQSLSISGTLNNFFTFTNYRGIDPETPGATYPVTRSVFFRLQAGF